MKVTVFILVFIISLPTLALAQNQQDEKTTKATKGLAPEQIKTLQVISRNVLAAKHSQKEDPDLQVLRARVKELRKAIRDLKSDSLAINSDGVENLVQEQGKVPAVTEKERDARAAKRQAAKQKLRSALTAMRGQRKKTSEKKLGAGQKGRATLIANATAKVEKLENKLEALLELQDAEQAEKFQEILEQMKITERRTVMPSTDEAPTITRIRGNR